MSSKAERDSAEEVGSAESLGNSPAEDGKDGNEIGEWRCERAAAGHTARTRSKAAVKLA